MANFTVVIITKNEAANITACLQPLSGLADEILVVDSHSTDNTRELAAERGARVVETDWRGYAATKNYANSLAKNDWILSIDADEVVSEELTAQLRHLQPEAETVYLLDRHTYFCGTWVNHSGWYPDWKVRLFDRRQVHWQGDYVHETLAIPEHFRQVKLKGKLQHYSYRSHADHWARMEKYARLSAREMIDAGKQISALRPYLSAIGRFVRTFFLKSGWRDGRIGWTISVRNAWLAHRKYSLARRYRDKPEAL